MVLALNRRLPLTREDRQSIQFFILQINMVLCSNQDTIYTKKTAHDKHILLRRKWFPVLLNKEIINY